MEAVGREMLRLDGPLLLQKCVEGKERPRGDLNPAASGRSMGVPALYCSADIDLYGFFLNWWAVQPPHLCHKILIYKIIKSLKFVDAPGRAPVKWWLLMDVLGRHDQYAYLMGQP
jgi:hypothetical protein